MTITTHTGFDHSGRSPGGKTYVRQGGNLFVLNADKKSLGLNMVLTSQNAIDLLVASPSNYNTADKLRALVAQVNTAASDSRSA